MREINIKSEEIKGLIIQKGAIVVEGRKLNEQLDKTKVDLNNCGLEINKLNAVLIPLVKELNIELAEFERIESIELAEDELVVKIYDALEEFKVAFNEQKIKEELDSNKLLDNQPKVAQ